MKEFAGLLSQIVRFTRAICLKPCLILDSSPNMPSLFQSRFQAHYAAQVVCSSEGATAAPYLLFGRA
jgi:hypothetical protein